MAIEGPTFKCGREIDDSELWPTPDFPRIPLLLEHAGIAVAGWGHRRSSHLYILWQFEPAKSSFLELVRVVAHGNEWVDAIKRPALQAIFDPDALSARTASIAAKRVYALVEAELQFLDVEARGHFISRLYEEAAGRLTYFD